MHVQNPIYNSSRWTLPGPFLEGPNYKPGIRKYCGLKKSLFGWLLKLMGMAFKVTRDGPLLSKQSAIGFINRNKSILSSVNHPIERNLLSFEKTTRVRTILFNFLNSPLPHENAPLVINNLLPRRPAAPAVTPRRIYKFIPTYELYKMDISEMSHEEICFHFPSTSSDGRKRFIMLSRNSVNRAFLNGKLNNSYLISLLSDGHYLGLEIHNASAEQLAMLFPPLQENDKENKERFAKLGLDNFKQAIENNKLNDPYLVSLFSEDQIGCLAISKLTSQQIAWLFPQNRQDNTQKFAKLSLPEVVKAVENGKINIPYLLDLAGRRVSMGEKFNIGLFDISKFGQVQIKWLFETQIFDISAYTDLSEQQIKWLFPEGQENTKERFAKFPVYFLNEALESNKINDPYLFSLISIDQLTGLDIPKLTEKQLELLFPQDRSDNKERFQHIKGSYVLGAYKNNLLTSYLMTLLSKPQKDLLDLFKKGVSKGDTVREESLLELD